MCTCLALVLAPPSLPRSLVRSRACILSSPALSSPSCPSLQLLHSPPRTLHAVPTAEQLSTLIFPVLQLCIPMHASSTCICAALPQSASPYTCFSDCGYRTVKIWDMKKLKGMAEEQAPMSLKVARTWMAHDKDINSAHVSPNDSLLATGSADRTVKLWECSSGKDLASSPHGRQPGILLGA